MCLAVPAQVIEIGENNMAVISLQTIQQRISTALVDVNVGDWVLVHAGFAINVIDEEEALGTIQILREMGEIPEA